MTRQTCKNCQHEVTANYCAHCGQKTSVEALTTVKLIKDFSDNVFQINHGLFYSIKEMTLHPGQSIANYLDGKRKQYFQPIAYAFTLATLYFLLTKVIGHSTFVDHFTEGYLLAVDDINSTLSEANLNFMTWLASNYAYTTLLVVPLFAFASYIAFINEKRGFLEHVVLHLYITGHQSLIYGISALIGVVGFDEDIMEVLTVICSMIYAIIVYLTFFTKKLILLRVVQALLSYLIALVFITIGLGIIVVIGESGV